MVVLRRKKGHYWVNSANTVFARSVYVPTQEMADDYRLVPDAEAKLLMRDLDVRRKEEEAKAQAQSQSEGSV